MHGDERHPTLLGQHQALEDRGIAEATAAQRVRARPQGAEETVGARDVDDRRTHVLSGEELAGGERLRDHRAARGDHDPGAGTTDFGLGQAVAAGQHVIAQRGPVAALEQRHKRILRDRRGREPQVVRLTVGQHDVAQPVQHHPLGLERVAGLPHRQPGQLHADRRGDRRLVCTALARQRDTRRRTGEDKARTRVDRVDEGIQTAADERVVDRADGQQLLPVQLGTQPELAEQEEEVHLGDAELDVLTLRRRLPLERTGVLDLEDLLDLGAEHAALVDPAAEPRRDGDIRAGRDQVARHLLHVGDVLEHAGEGILTRRRARHDRSELVRDGIGIDAPCRRGVPLAQSLGRRQAEPSLGCRGCEACPLVRRVGELPAQLLDLRGRQERRVVHRVAGDRQPPTLDGEGEDDGGPLRVGVGALEGGDHVAEVMAAQIADQRRQSCILVGLEYTGQRLALAGGRVVDDELADIGTALAEQALVLRVRHRVDAPLQRFATIAREGLAQPRAVLDDFDLPAMVAEDVRELLRANPGDHAIETLTVEVDDPRELPETAGGRVGQRLPDVALVELGVTQQRDEAAPRLNVEVGADVPIHHAGEQRRGSTEANGPGREVNRIGVLGARRVGLQTTEPTQLRQVLAIEAPEQVVDRVEDRRGVRLDRDAIARLQPVEVERRHRRHHRCRRGLVTADLELVIRRALVVGVVDHPRREPEHASLN